MNRIKEQRAKGKTFQHPAADESGSIYKTIKEIKN
jgi:hypothetical protein